MTNEVVQGLSPKLVAPFGVPESWEAANVCVKNTTNFCGVLVRNRCTRLYMIFNGYSLANIEQNFAQNVWDRYKNN